jgi:hypothetical protein
VTGADRDTTLTTRHRPKEVFLPRLGCRAQNILDEQHRIVPVHLQEINKAIFLI